MNTKWILGGLGWVLLGPIGGIIGFLVGSAVDSSDIKKLGQGEYKEKTQTKFTGKHTETYYQKPKTEYRKTNYSYGMPTQLGDFMVSMLILIAEVMKADGSILKSELNYVKKYFNEKFGEDKTSEALRILKILLNKQIPIYEVTEQICSNLDYYSRLQLVHFLFGLAQSDGEIHTEEIKRIDVISRGLQITDKDYLSIKAMFLQNEESPYEILQISKDATNDEIKASYRKLAKEFHPDKVSYLGDEVQMEATEKFKKITEAYEKLKQKKGFV
jgi:DnaJ like chaperone protein